MIRRVKVRLKAGASTGSPPSPLGTSGAVLDAVGLGAHSLQLQAQNPGFHSSPGFHRGGGFHSGGVSTSSPCRGATTASAVVGSPGMIGAL